MTTLFLVFRGPGHSWVPGTPTREQPLWNEHAAFMDRLFEQGRVRCDPSLPVPPEVNVLRGRRLQAADFGAPADQQGSEAEAGELQMEPWRRQYSDQQGPN